MNKVQLLMTVSLLMLGTSLCAKNHFDDFGKTNEELREQLIKSSFIDGSGNVNVDYMSELSDIEELYIYDIIEKSFLYDVGVEKILVKDNTVTNIVFEELNDKSFDLLKYNLKDFKLYGNKKNLDFLNKITILSNYVEKIEFYDGKIKLLFDVDSYNHTYIGKLLNIDIDGSVVQTIEVVFNNGILEAKYAKFLFSGKGSKGVISIVNNIADIEFDEFKVTKYVYYGGIDANALILRVINRETYKSHNLLFLVKDDNGNKVLTPSKESVESYCDKKIKESLLCRDFRFISAIKNSRDINLLR